MSVDALEMGPEVMEGGADANFVEPFGMGAIKS
jgi:hypothetical protein